MLVCANGRTAKEMAMSASEPTFDRGRPGLLQKLFFKAPIALYRDGPAEIMRSRCVMLITTIGRKSGLPRTNGVSFMPLDDHFVVFSGWGVRSDWYRNLVANPDVTIRVGNREMKATAAPVADPERRRELMHMMRGRAGRCGPPGPFRWLLKRTGIFDYEGELDMALQQGGALPVVELFPKSRATSPS
jgi:deazaflavin-dependent oxidoreductase (nitroreductase family)